MSPPTTPAIGTAAATRMRKADWARVKTSSAMVAQMCDTAAMFMMTTAKFHTTPDANSSAGDEVCMRYAAKQQAAPRAWQAPVHRTIVG